MLSIDTLSVQSTYVACIFTCDRNYYPTNINKYILFIYRYFENQLNRPVLVFSKRGFVTRLVSFQNSAFGPTRRDKSSFARTKASAHMGWPLYFVRTQSPRHVTPLLFRSAVLLDYLVQLCTSFGKRPVVAAGSASPVHFPVLRLYYGTS